MYGGVGRQQGGGVGRKDAQYVYMPSPLCIDMGICFYVLHTICSVLSVLLRSLPTICSGMGVI